MSAGEAKWEDITTASTLYSTADARPVSTRRSYTCNDGCSIPSSYVNDNECDCTACEDESSYSCSTCANGCPSSCGSSPGTCVSSGGTASPTGTPAPAWGTPATSYPYPTPTPSRGGVTGNLLVFTQCSNTELAPCLQILE